MARILCIASLALAAVSAVSGHVIRHRRGPPPGWHSSLLQSYPEYHDRYLLWDCQNKHNSSFFDKCCHPLLNHESLDVLTGAGCDSDCDDGESPVTSSAPSSPLPTNTNPAPKAALAPAPSPSPTTSSAKFQKVADSPAPAAPSSSPPVTTSSHEAAPSPSPTSSNNNSGSDKGAPQTGGVATFFYQNGVAGACGQTHSDNDFICAMDQELYGDAGNASPLCGKQVIITNTQNGKTVTVTVADDCPTCNNKNSIDLSLNAFKQIADLSQGEVPISWVFK